MMPVIRRILPLALSDVHCLGAARTPAQPIDLLGYGAGLGLYETDGYADEPAAPALQLRGALQKTARSRVHRDCSQRDRNPLKGWVCPAADPFWREDGLKA